MVKSMYDVLWWVCQIWTKFAEAKLRYINLNGLNDLRDTSNESQIIGVVDRECSKTVQNQQTLITNRLHEALILTLYTQNDDDNKLFGKASLSDIVKLPLCPSTPYTSPLSSYFFVKSKTYLWWGCVKLFLQNGRATIYGCRFPLFITVHVSF